MTEFFRGDIVDLCGLRGIIINTENDEKGYPISVRFGDDKTMSFTRAGAILDTMPEPKLKVITSGRAKILVAYINLYKTLEGQKLYSEVFTDKSKAERAARCSRNFLATQKVEFNLCSK